MSGELTPGGPITAEKLREIADWLDVYDEVTARWIRGIGPIAASDDELLAGLRVVTGEGSKEVQDDLRRWAEELEDFERWGP